MRGHGKVKRGKRDERKKRNGERKGMKIERGERGKGREENIYIWHSRSSPCI